MNSLLFQGSKVDALLADLDAMCDFLGMVKTPEVDAIRPLLDARLQRARRLLEARPVAVQASARRFRRPSSLVALAALSAFTAALVVVQFKHD